MGAGACSHCRKEPQRQIQLCVCGKVTPSTAGIKGRSQALHTLPHNCWDLRLSGQDSGHIIEILSLAEHAGTLRYAQEALSDSLALQRLSSSSLEIRLHGAKAPRLFTRLRLCVV